MFSSLKEMMRKTSFYFTEVIFERREVPVRRCSEQEFKFGLVNLETVDLLMVECEALDDGSWVEQFSPGIAEA